MAKATNKPAEVGSAFDLLGKSYEIVKKNWQAFVVVNILALISAVVPYKPNVDQTNTDKFDFQSFLSSITGIDITSNSALRRVVLGFFIFLVIYLAITLYIFTMSVILQVRSTAGKKPSVGLLINKAKKHWIPMLGLLMLSAIIIVVGLILLIVPGIIAIGRLAMAPLLMVDKDLGVIEAMKASNEMGKKHIWKVLAAVGVTFLVGIASAIFGVITVFGTLIGTIFGIIFSLVVPLRYQQLKKLK